MKERARFVIIGMIVLFVGIAWVSREKPGTLNSASAQEIHNVSYDIPIDVKQLQTDTGFSPVEVMAPRAWSQVKNEVTEFSCVIKNNTTKNITAISLTITTTIEDSGKEILDSKFLSSDSALHPDIKEERHMTSTGPGATQLMQLPGPTRYREDISVKNLHVEIAHVEFDDKSTLGYDMTHIAARRIQLTRAGAAKYKEWLKKQYRQSGDLPESIIQQINSPISPEYGLLDESLKSGADVYRKWILRVHNTKSIDHVITYLTK